MYAAGVHSCKSRSGAGRRAARAGGRHDISDGQRRRPPAISGNPNITPPSKTFKEIVDKIMLD